jgi:DNA-binding MarR family transcriptional regulator
LIQELMQAGRELSVHAMMFHATVAERLGLNPTDHKALDLLVRGGPLTAGQLADQTGLTTGAITGVIDRLEERGFVRRVKDANDRRRVVVEAVKERLPEVGRLFGSLARAWASFCGRYSDKDLAVVVDFLANCPTVFHEETLKLREGKIDCGSGPMDCGGQQ